jgi:hypothetical protein
MEAVALLCKRPQHKFSLKHGLVRDVEPRMIYDLIIIQQNIEIDVARSLIDDLFPPELILNTLEHI